MEQELSSSLSSFGHSASVEVTAEVIFIFLLFAKAMLRCVICTN